MRTLPVSLSPTASPRAAASALSRSPAVDVAVEQRERGLPGAQQVVVPGLAQPLGEVGVLGEGGAEGRRAVLQLRGGRQQQGLGVPFRVVGPLGEVGDLGGDRGPGVAVPGVHSVSCWASRQLASVAGSSRGGRSHRPLGQRPGPRAVGGHGVLQLAGQRRGHLRLGGGAACRAAPARAVSSTATRSVRGMAKRAPTAVQAQRDRAEQVGLAGGGGAGPGGVEQRPRRGGVAGPQPQVGLGGEQADQVGVGQPVAGGGDRGAHPGQVAGGLGEREPGGVGVGRGARPGHRGRGAGHRDGGGEVAGQLGREHRAAPLVPAQQRGGDPVVQVQPAGRRRGPA